MKLAFMLALGVLLAETATAQMDPCGNRGIPPPYCCTDVHATRTLVVGSNSANAPAEDVAGEFSATVRDCSNLPIAGATVTVEYGGCGPDLTLSAIQTFPGISFDCATKTVSVITNQLGVAIFRVLGGARNDVGNVPGNLTSCAVIRVDGVFLATSPVAALDQAGHLDGVKPNDLSVVITDINMGNTARRDDINLDGAITPVDVATMISYVNQGRSTENTGAICP